MNAVVPAAGEGTRLRPLTVDRPKGLIEVGGQPLLAHVFDTLVHLDVHEIIVVVGYKGEQLREAFGTSYAGVPLRYVVQTKKLGLAHALLQAREHVEEPFVLLNGDNVFVDPIPPLRAMGEWDGILLVERADASVASETGVVSVEDGTVLEVREKPDEPSSTLITTGAYLLPPEIMDACAAIGPSQRGEYELADGINRLLADGYRFEACEYAGWRCNVNAPEDIETVERRLLD